MSAIAYDLAAASCFALLTLILLAALPVLAMTLREPRRGLSGAALGRLVLIRHQSVSVATNLTRAFAGLQSWPAGCEGVSAGETNMRWNPRAAIPKIRSTGVRSDRCTRRLFSVVEPAHVATKAARASPTRAAREPWSNQHSWVQISASVLRGRLANSLPA